MEVDEFLEHHGVKGMHWGIRNPTSDRGPSSEDHSHSRTLKKKPVRTLSNHEIRTVNQRLELEKKFRELNPKKTTAGKKYIQSAIATIGIGVSAYNIINGPFGKAATKIGQQALGINRPSTSDTFLKRLKEGV